MVVVLLLLLLLSLFKPGSSLIVISQPVPLQLGQMGGPEEDDLLILVEEVERGSKFLLLGGFLNTTNR